MNPVNHLQAALRPLVLVLTALALLSAGGLELAPRAAAASASALPAFTGAVAAPDLVRADASAPLSLLRAALVATTVVQGSGPIAPPPSSTLLVAPPLAPDASPPAPTAPAAGGLSRVSDSRAPPLTTGT